jgi:uncharacterized membrane protein
MEGFSDGVVSIAITLLVLEIAVPAGSGDDLLGALRDQWASYLGYLVSFATIGAVWCRSPGAMRSAGSSCDPTWPTRT